LLAHFLVDIEAHAQGNVAERNLSLALMAQKDKKKTLTSQR